MVIKLGNTNLVHVAGFITKYTNRSSNNTPILVIKTVHNLNVLHLVLHCPKWPLSTL